MKKLLFSLIPGRDLIFKTTTGSGPGGQHRNKTESTVMLSHPDSGVTVKAGDEKSQHRNKRIALRRLVANKKFKTWVRVQSAMIAQGYRNVEEKVNDLMRNKNLKVEYIDTFTCDFCKKKEETLSENRAEKKLPSGWEEREEGIHLCRKCRKMKST